MPTTIKASGRAWASRLLWFVGLYAAGVAVVGVVAYGLKALLIPH